MAQDDTRGPRIYLGPEAIKLATIGGNKASTASLEEQLQFLLTKCEQAKREVLQALSQRDEIQETNAALIKSVDGLKQLANAAVQRNNIEMEVAEVFQKHFFGLAKLQLHVSGLIGLKLTSDDNHQELVKDIQRIHGELTNELSGRHAQAMEHSRENAETTKRLAREVNDTRAAVEPSQAPELDFSLSEQGGHER